MKVFIENPSGTNRKREYDEKKGEWKEIGNLSAPYPYPYGFVPGTMQKDSDPLDAFLITNNPSEVKSGDLIEVEVLALVEYYEDGERDFKILVRSLEKDIEITDEVKSNLREFLLHAFDNKPEKRVEFKGFFGIDRAQKEIEKCQV